MSSLLVSLVQSDLMWENKAGNLQQLEQQIASVSGKSELVVLPEMFSTGFTMAAAEFAETMEGETVQWMKTMARQYRVVLTGSCIVAENNQFFNRMLWVLPDGNMGYYDKRHLFAYGGEDKHYSAGSKRLIASVKGFRIQLQICYDLRFPVWSRQQSTENNPEFDVLIYCANWPEKRIQAWRTLLVARAIENQCYVIGVNRVGKDGNGLEYPGYSMAVDPLGNIMYELEQEETTATVSLSKIHLEEVRQQFPFWKDGDQFTLFP